MSRWGIPEKLDYIDALLRRKTITIEQARKLMGYEEPLYPKEEFAKLKRTELYQLVEGES